MSSFQASESIAAGGSCTDSVHTLVLTRPPLNQTGLTEDQPEHQSGLSHHGLYSPVLDMFPPGDTRVDSWLPEAQEVSAERFHILSVYFMFCLLCQFAETKMRALLLGFYGAGFE